jgi:hypothetical protein
MSTRAFQGNVFQFVPEAFQSVQTVAASGTFGINVPFTAAARITLAAAGALVVRDGQGAAARATLKGATPAFVITDGLAGLAGLTFPCAGAFAIRLAADSAATAADRAAAGFVLTGTVAATAAKMLRASAGLSSRHTAAAPAAVRVAVAADVLALVGGVASAARATRTAVAAIGTNLAATFLGGNGFRAAGTLAMAHSVVDRQQFIDPHRSVNLNRLSFLHRIAHRGGGNRKRARALQPEKRPPTFAEFLDAWKPPPFVLPAPHLVRHSVRDLRPPPPYRPLAGGDVLAVERAIADAFDARDAFAMLERLLATEAAARESEDERDAAAVLSGMG